jgi:broad specificity phosphatase PhoE
VSAPPRAAFLAPALVAALCPGFAPPAPCAPATPDSVAAASLARIAPRDTSAVTVFVVRHAEAEPARPGQDPPLSAAGRVRAAALATALRDAGVTAIYTTHLERTRATGRPLADSLGIGVTSLPASDSAGLVARLEAAPPGATVLVVGHSNTVPEIVARLSGWTPPPIAHDDFGRLYVVTRAPGRAARVIALRLGAP